MSSVQARLPVKLSFSQHMQQAVKDTRTTEKPAETARADRKWFSLVPDIRYALEPETALPSAEPVAETSSVPATETAPQIPDGEYKTLGQTLSAFAAQFVGNPYVWGGEDLVKGADCSGFTQSVFKNFGISLPRTAYAQSKVGREVETADLQPGDLLASGTVSGAERGSRGCLLEMTWGGKESIELPGGEKRTFLEDGDEIIMRGYCEKSGAARIGFGECRGVIG
jgi:cell wall-associated NlpC family hydrolase